MFDNDGKSESTTTTTVYRGNIRLKCNRVCARDDRSVWWISCKLIKDVVFVPAVATMLLLVVVGTIDMFRGRVRVRADTCQERDERFPVISRGLYRLYSRWPEKKK